MFTRDNDESSTSMLRCRHLNVVEHLIKQFVDNFNFNI